MPLTDLETILLEACKAASAYVRKPMHAWQLRLGGSLAAEIKVAEMLTQAIAKAEAAKEGGMTYDDLEAYACLHKPKGGADAKT